MGKFNNNVLKANDYGFAKTKKQLENWGLKFNKLLLGKPEYEKISYSWF